MKLISSDDSLEINVNKLTSTSASNFTDLNSTTINANSTFSNLVTTNYKGMFEPPTSLTLTNVKGQQPPVITQGARYHYTSPASTGYFCGLSQSGNAEGNVITIINRGTVSIRIYGYGGWTTNTTSPDYKAPATDQYIFDHRGSLVPYITLGPTDWVEFVEQHTGFWGWIITEAVGI